MGRMLLKLQYWFGEKVEMHCFLCVPSGMCALFSSCWRVSLMLYFLSCWISALLSWQRSAATSVCPCSIDIPAYIMFFLNPNERGGFADGQHWKNSCIIVWTGIYCRRCVGVTGKHFSLRRFVCVFIKWLTLIESAGEFWSYCLCWRMAAGH